MQAQGAESARFRPLWIVLATMAVATAAHAQSSGPSTPSISPKNVEIVILGSGYPAPTQDRQGPALAIVVNQKAYLLDAGTGIVRQANAAFQRGITALRPDDLEIAFLTHLHSDHTLGLPDLILTPWVLGRTSPLKLFGPAGTKAMADHILEAYKEDIHVRTTGLEGSNATGYKVDAQDVQPGTIYKDDNLTVRAFLVKHGSWKEAFGYRFDAGGKSIVISGDTAPSSSIVDACGGCDALIHEVYAGTLSPGTTPSAERSALSTEQWMKYMGAFHTSGVELGEIAARAKPKMLVLTHWILLGTARPEDMVRDIRTSYGGPIVVARDLDLITP